MGRFRERHGSSATTLRLSRLLERRDEPEDARTSLHDRTPPRRW